MPSSAHRVLVQRASQREYREVNTAPLSASPAASVMATRGWVRSRSDSVTNGDLPARSFTSRSRRRGAGGSYTAYGRFSLQAPCPLWEDRFDGVLWI